VTSHGACIKPGTTRSVRRQDISEAVRALGLQHRPVCLHTSLRSFGGLAGGVGAVLGGFLDEGCTIMVPTFTYEHAVAPPLELSPPQNGYDYTRSSTAHARPGPIYTPDSPDVSDDMGALPRALLRLPGRVRGDHPLNSFSAVGPLSHTLVGGQTSTDVYAPFRSLTEHGVTVVLIGVGLTRMTLLHEAERRAGRNLFWRWALDKGGETVSVRVGGCSEGFESLGPVLAGLERTRRVGESLWRGFPVRGTLERAAAAIRAEPDLTDCGDPGCQRCADAAKGGPDAALERRMLRSWRPVR